MGQKTKIMGIPVEIESEEVCAEADFMVCCLKEVYDKSPDTFVPGTKGGYFCIACNRELIMAPSGRKIAAMGNNRQICMDCVMKVSHDDKDIQFARSGSPEAEKELKH